MIKVESWLWDWNTVLRIRIRDPGSGTFLTPGSGIRNRIFRIPGPTIIFESLKPIFSWLKKWKNAKCATVMSQDLFQQERKATKRWENRYKKNFFTSPCFFGIRDPGSEIRDPGWEKIRIRDKHLGSATLLKHFLTDNPAIPRFLRKQGDMVIRWREGKGRKDERTVH
jgi:hypothetical protein